jgi:hypothetical protein
MRRAQVLAGVAVAVVALLMATDPANATIITRTSALGAGYRSTPAGGVSSARVRFKVPAITCVSDTGFEALYLGATSLNDIGERSAYANVWAECNDSLTPTYFMAAFTADGGFKQGSVAIGDIVVASLTETGTKTTAKVNNLTEKISISSSTNATKDPSVLLGDFGEPTVPTFTKVNFNEAMVNGLPIDQAATPVVRQRLKSNNTLQIGTHLITTSDQKQFAIDFRANS